MGKVGFFETSEGNKSAMRLNSFISLLTAIAISIYATITKQLEINTISLVTMFVVSAFAPKAVQKFAENNIEEKNNG